MLLSRVDAATLTRGSTRTSIVDRTPDSSQPVKTGEKPVMSTFSHSRDMHMVRCLGSSCNMLQLMLLAVATELPQAVAVSPGVFASYPRSATGTVRSEVPVMAQAQWPLRISPSTRGRQVRWWMNSGGTANNLKLIDAHPKAITGLYTYLGLGVGDSGHFEHGTRNATNLGELFAPCECPSILVNGETCVKNALYHVMRLIGALVRKTFAADNCDVCDSFRVSRSSFICVHDVHPHLHGDKHTRSQVLRPGARRHPRSLAHQREHHQWQRRQVRGRGRGVCQVV